MKAKYTALCQRAHALLVSSAERIATPFLLLFGIGVLASGLQGIAEAQGGLGSPGSAVSAGDLRLEEAGTRLFELIEGNLGSLIMITAGLAAIVSAALGAYRAAVGMLIVAVGAFILKSLVVIFFDYGGQ